MNKSEEWSLIEQMTQGVFTVDREIVFTIPRHGNKKYRAQIVNEIPKHYIRTASLANGYDLYTLPGNTEIYLAIKHGTVVDEEPAEDAVDPKEKEIQIKAYKKKLDEYRALYREYLNRADERWLHYYQERIKEVEAKLRALGANDAEPERYHVQVHPDRSATIWAIRNGKRVEMKVPKGGDLDKASAEFTRKYGFKNAAAVVDAQPSARYKELLKKRDEAEKKAREASARGDKTEQKKWTDLMWKYNDELKWLGPEVTNPTKGPAPDGSGESWLRRKK